MLEANPRRAGGALGQRGADAARLSSTTSAAASFRSARPARRSRRWTCRARASSGGTPATRAVTPPSTAASPASRAATRSRPRRSAARATRTRFARWRGFTPASSATCWPRCSVRFRASARSLRVGVGPLLKIAGMFLRSTRGLASRLFESEAARRVLPGLGLHVDVGPDDRFGAGLALHARGHRDHGRLRLPERRRAEPDRRAASPGSRSAAARSGSGARVTRVIVRDGRAAAVVLDDGTEIAARRAIVADTSPASLLLSMIDEREVPGWVRGFMKRFPAGLGDLQGGLGAVGAGALAGRGGARERGRARGRERRRSRPVHARGARRPSARAALPGDRAAEPRRSDARAGRQAHALLLHARPVAGRRRVGRRARGLRRSRRGAHRGAGAGLSRVDPGPARHGAARSRGLEREPASAAISAAARTPGTASSCSGRCSPTSGTACR